MRILVLIETDVCTLFPMNHHSDSHQLFYPRDLLFISSTGDDRRCVHCLHLYLLSIQFA